MEQEVKIEADIYFQSEVDLEARYNLAVSQGKSIKFYVLLIAKYLGKDDLFSQIMKLNISKQIDWDAFVNAIWGYSLYLAEGSNSFVDLANFVTELDHRNLFEKSLLFKSLSEGLLEAANLEKKSFLEKKAQRAYTKFYYDQRKNNLIRENNEGYAKLCLLLATAPTTESSELIWEKILSLMGNFDLDPDRILDLVIETFIETNNENFCVPLLKHFNPHSISAILGNRIARHVSPEMSEKLIYTGKVEVFLSQNFDEYYKEILNLINPKLITILCKLVKENTLTFDSVLPYLSPADSIIELDQIKRIQNGKEKISQCFILAMEQLTEDEQLRIREEENVRFLGQMLYSSKLALMNGFLGRNDWRNFKKLWKIYETKLDLIIYQPILRSLFQMLEWVIDPVYEKIAFCRYFKTEYSKVDSFPVHGYSMGEEDRVEMTQMEDVSLKELEKILEIFEIIKIYIGFDTRVYTKICRLFYKIIKEPLLFQNQHQEPEQEDHIKVVKEIQSIIKMYLLPAVSLQESNPLLSKEVYQLLELFDYRFRYKCYLYHYSEAMIQNPYFAHIFYKIRNQQTVLVNNLSHKNKKLYMKKIAKLTHNQALQTFYWIFRRILLGDYEKVVPEIVAALGNCCSLALEMSIFTALHILNENKLPSENFKTGEQSPWFKNLVNFISLFYRKYLEVEIQPIFDYIIMKIGQPISELEENEELPGGLLNLLHELLSKMFCNFVLKEVNKSKLEELCAGPKLQLEAMDISEEIKASKKSKIVLEKFFWGKSVDQYDGQSLAMSLLVLLTQKRAEIVHKSELSNIKIIGDIYDDYTTLIIQLIRVLSELSSGHEQYSKLLPENSLDLLINEYKLPLEIAFEIFRPSVSHISYISEEEWVLLTKNVGKVIDKFVSSQEKFIENYGKNEKLKKYLNENYLKMGDIMSYEFFTTFWMLTLDSVYFPSKIYSEKIEEIKKKAEQRFKCKTEKDVEKIRNLLLDLKTEEETQNKKVSSTLSEQKVSRFKVEYLKKNSKEETNISHIQKFAEVFVQICLLPRMMLDPEEALYCMKITIEVIKFNRLAAAKSIKLLIYIIEHVMSYLPYSTERESAYCLSIFLSEMLIIISNWNDINKLKQDLKKSLLIDEGFCEENYPKLKKQFLRLFYRFGNIIKSIKDEPYCIRNCLFLLEKMVTVPAYKKQAQDLEDYLKELKERFSTILPTIIEMQLSLIALKKKTLPIVEEDSTGVENRDDSYFANGQRRPKLELYVNREETGNIKKEDHKKVSKLDSKPLEDKLEIEKKKNHIELPKNQILKIHTNADVCFETKPKEGECLNQNNNYQTEVSTEPIEVEENEVNIGCPSNNMIDLMVNEGEERNNVPDGFNSVSEGLGKEADKILLNEKQVLTGDNNDHANWMIDEKVLSRNINIEPFVFDSSLIKRTDSMVIEIVPINVDEEKEVLCDNSSQRRLVETVKQRERSMEPLHEVDEGEKTIKKAPLHCCDVEEKESFEIRNEILEESSSNQEVNTRKNKVTHQPSLTEKLEQLAAHIKLKKQKVTDSFFREHLQKTSSINEKLHQVPSSSNLELKANEDIEIVELKTRKERNNERLGSFSEPPKERGKIRLAEEKKEKEEAEYSNKNAQVEIGCKETTKPLIIDDAKESGELESGEISSGEEIESELIKISKQEFNPETIKEFSEPKSPKKIDIKEGIASREKLEETKGKSLLKSFGEIGQKAREVKETIRRS